MLDAANWTTRLGELARQARVPGAVLGIWAGGQEILAACGVLNRSTRVRVSTDSVFQVGSITKLWTATMIMQLIDAGLLSLDTTVDQALPGLRLGSADRRPHAASPVRRRCRTSRSSPDRLRGTLPPSRRATCARFPRRRRPRLERRSPAGRNAPTGQRSHRFPPGSSTSALSSSWPQSFAHRR